MSAFMGNEMQLIMHHPPDVAREMLSKTLRDDGFLVSSEPSKIIVDIPAYDGVSHGPFGFGPKWQEKVVIYIQIDELSLPRKLAVEQPDYNAVFSPPNYLHAPNVSQVRVDPKIYERQNSHFKWIEIDESERADSIIRPLLLKLQSLSAK